MLSHGLTEFFTHGETSDQFCDKAFVAGGFNAVRLKLETFDDADISIQASA